LKYSGKGEKKEMRRALISLLRGLGGELEWDLASIKEGVAKTRRQEDLFSKRKE